MNISDKGDWRESLLKASGFSAEQLQQASGSADEEVSAGKTERPKEKLSIFVEKKGRGGKVATIVAGFTCSDEELKEIASRLKNSLGCGGSYRGGEILVQGSRREQVASLLREMGYKI